MAPLLHRAAIKSAGGIINFCPGVQKLTGSGWTRDSHHPGEVAGSTRLPQGPQVDAGGSGPHDSRPAADPATKYLRKLSSIYCLAACIFKILLAF